MRIDQKIKASDLNFGVAKLKVKGKAFWPFFKVFFFDAQFVQGGTQTTFTLGQKIKFLKSLFYGFFNWFGPVDYLVFSNSDQRKLIDGLYVDKSADFIHQKLANTLHIELPVFIHFPLKLLPYKRVVSQLPLRILEGVYAKLFLKDADVTGVEVAKQLNNDFGTNTDVVAIGKRFYAQYWLMKKLLSWKKPKAVFMAVPYMKMGYVLAAREAGIPVVEMQHGSINKSHFGYVNYTQVNPLLFPSYLFAYGSDTKKVFQDDNITFAEQNVIPIGHYYLHLIQKKDSHSFVGVKPILSANVSISISLQDDSVGKQIVPFMIEVAKRRPGWKIVFIPRKTPRAEYEKMNLPSNIHFLPHLNVYEVIKVCKLHTTAFSTCALEAPTLGKCNILVNIDNKAMEYFSEILNNSQVTTFVNSVSEYIEAVENHVELEEDVIMRSNQAVIRPNFDQNLTSALTLLKNNMG